MAEKGGPHLLDGDTVIDEIIAKKGIHNYTDGLSEEKWEEELEQIPLFMTKSPDVIDPERGPGLAALQDLKYELSTPEGRASSCKEEGNEHFRLKRYHKAVKEYTAGVREGVDDHTLQAILYTNRAAAQYHLGNLRSCLMDVTEARKLKSDHLKAFHRGAMACMKLHHYQQALDWCNDGLLVSPEDGVLMDMQCKASGEMKVQERDKRKQARIQRKKDVEKQKLLVAIKERNIQLASSASLGNAAEGDDATPSLELVLDDSHPSGEKVHLDSDGRLVWPVLFLYPEHGQTDLISSFHEDHMFRDHLEVMFVRGSHPAWDRDHKYTADSMQIYYEDRFGGGLIGVDADRTLGSVLASNGYTVGGGTPTFFLLASGSPFTPNFLQRASCH